MAAGAVVAAAAAAHQRRVQAIFDAFRLAGATAPDRACTLDALQLDAGERELIELMRNRVILLGSAPGAWYLSEAAVIDMRARKWGKRRVVLLTAGLGVLVLLVGLALLITARG